VKLVVAVGGLFVCSLAHAQKPEPKPDMDKLLDKCTFTKRKASLPYRLLKPDDYDKGGDVRYPLVVFLHGIGERGADNAKQLLHGVTEFVKESTRKKHSCFLAAPQCPPDNLWVFVTPWDVSGNLSLAKSPTQPTAMVLDLIDSLSKEYRIDADRIYLTGISLGGYCTWDLASRYPGLFAAAMPICGGGDPAKAEKLAKLPIWAFHGDADTSVPVERSRDMIAAIKKAGGAPKYTEYKGVGHDSWTPTYKNDEVLDWLFEQKKGK
jgi:predicted peptidase